MDHSLANVLRVDRSLSLNHFFSLGSPVNVLTKWKHLKTKTLYSTRKQIICKSGKIRKHTEILLAIITPAMTCGHGGIITIMNNEHVEMDTGGN